MQDKYAGDASGALSVRLWLRLLTCSTIIEKRLRRRFVDEFDTTLPRFDVMAALYRHPDGITMGELSRALLVSNGNVTALVRQLQEQGHARIAPSPDDRRASIVCLTPDGMARFTVLAEAHHGWIAEVFSGIPPAQQEALLGLLAILKDQIMTKGAVE
ncbi:MarR family transcriptional regulator [Tistrella bauzanensis]|uniref:MarR family transcriptional regulator n=1 Tax=Tistrella arctica TaxID=3133430 RepID=A0ABU9YGF1_9PROT